MKFFFCDEDGQHVDISLKKKYYAYQRKRFFFHTLFWCLRILVYIFLIFLGLKLLLINFKSFHKRGERHLETILKLAYLHAN